MVEAEAAGLDFAGWDVFKLKRSKFDSKAFSAFLEAGGVASKVLGVLVFLTISLGLCRSLKRVKIVLRPRGLYVVYHP